MGRPAPPTTSYRTGRPAGWPWCAKGADVTYKPVVLLPLGNALLNHFAPLLTDQGDAISWLTDRLDGRPAGSNCATLPYKP